MRNLVITFFVLINLAGFTMSLLEYTESSFSEGPLFSIPAEIRLTTISAFGGGIGCYAGCFVGGEECDDVYLKTALQLIILQNVVTFLLILRAFRKKRKSADYNRSSLSLK